MSAAQLHLVDEKPNTLPETKTKSKSKSAQVPAKKPPTKTGVAMPKAKAPKDATTKPTSAPFKQTSPGVVKAKKKQPAATTETKAHPVTVADVMQGPGISCRAHDSLNDAARLMWEHDVGALVVVNEAHEPMGMITDRDACMAVYTQGVILAHRPVSSAMSKTLSVCEFSASLAEVHAKMASAQVRRLPVVDAQGKLVGLVALTDLMRAHTLSAQGRAKETSGLALLQLMDAILKAPVSETAEE